MTLYVVPLTLREANRLVLEWHRHHKPTRGQRFSIGVIDERGVLHGAAIAGRPVSRGCPVRDVLEVTRLVTDGTPNACSMLYAAVARAGKEMGFKKVQTYILTEEPGTSLKAAGWTLEAETQGGQWVRSEGTERRTDQPNGPKLRWAKSLASARPDMQLDAA